MVIKIYDVSTIVFLDNRCIKNYNSMANGIKPKYINEKYHTNEKIYNIINK